MFQATLTRILDEMRELGCSPQPPCPPAAIERLKLASIERFGCSVPDGYAEFLAARNGLDWNGLVVYASERSKLVGFEDRFLEGLVEGNLDYRDGGRLYDELIFADDGTALYVYCISAAEYRVMLNVGSTVLKTYATFEELLADALSAHA